MHTSTPPELAGARETFLSLVAQLRPELHRYSARLVGSALEGEDVVQEALARAFYALSQSPELPPLRPWLFRIAHNAAIDHLRRRTMRREEPLPEEGPLAYEERSDPLVLRAALRAFLALPVSQRSAVILKDVLGESLEEIAALQGTTVEAVKALLSRGRASLRARAEEPAGETLAPPSSEHRAQMERYVRLFNARDWSGVQAMLAQECELDLVAKAQRRGPAVGGYLGRYAQEQGLRFAAGRCEGHDAVGVFAGEPEALAYVILLRFEGEQVRYIQDFRYVSYLARELRFEER